MINEVQAIVSIIIVIGLQFVDLQNNACSRVIARFAYLEYLFRTVRIAKLVHGVLLIYLVVSSALER